MLVPLRNLTPFAFLALVPLGAILGDAWTVGAAATTLLSLTGLDAVMGRDDAAPRDPDGNGHRWLPRAYIVLQLAVTAWAAARVAGPRTSAIEFIGTALSVGVTTGVFGFVAAHEMIHSPDRRERALGLMLLGSVGYMHFRIAHVYGHHRRAATRQDPASARLGESLYAFLPRTIGGQFREAWQFEARRLRRAGRATGNRMVLYIALEMALAFVVGLASLRALLFVVIVAVLAIGLLETFNYVAHYGLTRRTNADGCVEPLGPRHSWNVVRRVNNSALFNMGRHSDHHRIMTRSYAQLKALAGAAELPAGYGSALVLALVPPLWRRVMDPRARATLEGSA